MSAGFYTSGRWHGSLVERPRDQRERRSAIARREEQLTEVLTNIREQQARARRLRKEIARLRTEEAKNEPA